MHQGSAVLVSHVRQCIHQGVVVYNQTSWHAQCRYVCDYFTIPYKFSVAPAQPGASSKCECRDHNHVLSIVESVIDRLFFDNSASDRACRDRRSRRASGHLIQVICVQTHPRQ